MKKKLRLALAGVLVTALAVSCVMLAYHQLQYRESASSYEEAVQIANFEAPKAVPAPAPVSSDGGEEDPVQAALSRIDLAALQAVNADVAGWIYIPNTELSYPLLHGKDNSFYLTRMWDKTRNNGGSIFFDYRCEADFSNYNTVLYGHRMRNDSMFGTLKYYKNQDFWQEHPIIYIMNSKGVSIYDIFAAWEPSITSVVYTMDFADDGGKQEFLDASLSGSKLETGIVPGPSDKILTLSTCTGNGHATRWVVQAVLREIWTAESTTKGSDIKGSTEP